MTRTSQALLAIALALLLGPAAVQAQAAKPNSADLEVMSTETFLNAHPDLRYRVLGLDAYTAGRYEEALAHFRRAARFADKPSQGMVAEMLWRGQGEAANRPLAYAWMDLAAERQFKVMLLNRERYWSELSEAEREQAITLGEAVYAEYGDAVAKPRLERRLRNARRNTTGSRTGFTGALTIVLSGPNGDVTLDGSQFFQDKFWKPETYWAWQAEDWKELPKGRVDVGPLQAPAANERPTTDDDKDDSAK